VEKTGRCLIVHEDNITAGFGAEIAATLAQESFWHLDAPVERLAPKDIPVAYHENLLAAMMPDVELIAERIEAVLGA
jgi:2-oxoisovalerate dehydrogenase E1 component